MTSDELAGFGMSSITLSKSAIKKLMVDPKLREHGRRLPILVHFLRSYSTLHDGTVIEHGEGFSLMFIDPDDEKAADGTVCAPVKVADDLDILVCASPSIMSGDLTIGWSKWSFTREPDDPS